MTPIRNICFLMEDWVNDFIDSLMWLSCERDYYWEAFVMLSTLCSSTCRSILLLFRVLSQMLLSLSRLVIINSWVLLLIKR